MTSRKSSSLSLKNQQLRTALSPNPTHLSTLSFTKQDNKDQHFQSGPNQPMLQSEVADIDQPLYDWGIENRMDQYYNAPPLASTYVHHQQPVHEVPNYPPANGRHFTNPVGHNPVPQGGQVISSSISIPRNSNYNIPEQMPNAQGNQIEESGTLCHTKESSSSPNLPSLNRGGVIIKQEQESIYDAKISRCLNANENGEANNLCTRLDEFNENCERTQKNISHRQTTHCQFDTQQANQQHLVQYSYDNHQMHPSMTSNNTMNQQPNFHERIQNGDFNNGHGVTRGRGPGSNSIQAVDMDVNEILKVERKRARNRVAATKCRLRKLERISVLDGEASNLRDKNDALAKTTDQLKQEVSELKQELRWHVNNGCKAWRLDRNGQSSLIEEVMAGEDDIKPSVYSTHEIKACTGVIKNDGNLDGCENTQYLERIKFRGEHGIICDETSNNNTGFQTNYLSSSNPAVVADDRKQNIVASPDSTTAISGERNPPTIGRSTINNTRTKIKSTL